MAKKERKLTPQEERVTAFARHSISSRSTFHPRQWRSGKEPADMVIAIGRTVLVFNMHEGKSYFEDLVRHNLQQARDRLLEWEGGRQIRGENKWRSFAIGWADVDQIAIISVVDGRHAACVDHDPGGLGMPAKVRLCTTVTSKVIYELAIKSGSARDLLVVCRLISGAGIISEQEVINMLQHRHDNLYLSAKAGAPVEPTRLGRALIKGKEVSWFDQFRYLFERLRREDGSKCEIFSDLSWLEIFPAVAFITATAARIEGLETGAVLAAEFGSSNTFHVVVSSSMKHFDEFIGPFMEKIAMTNSRFIVTISLTGIGVMPMFAISNKSLPYSIELDLKIG